MLSLLLLSLVLVLTTRNIQHIQHAVIIIVSSVIKNHVTRISRGAKLDVTGEWKGEWW